MATVGLLQEDISCRIFGKAYEFAKHKLLYYETLDTSRMKICEAKQPRVEDDSDSGCKIMELVKFTGVGRP